MTRYASLAAQIVRLVRVAGGTPAADSDPARLLPVAQQALGRRRRFLALRRAALGTVTLAAAAVVVLAAGPWLRSGRERPAGRSSSAPHSFSILNPEDAGPSARGPALSTGITLQAPPAAPVELGSTDGTVVTLEARGELALLEQAATRRFSLRRGAVRAHVAHLHTGERFIIATDDAEVEVHGTVFRVSLAEADPACENGRRTRVAVTEGIVSVRAGGRQTLVAAGDTWPSCARPDVPVAPAPASTEVAAPADTPPTPSPELPERRHFRAPPAAKPRPTAGLAAANDMFAAAVRAKREHRTNEALRLFARLIELAPEGPLAEGAAAQEMKLLATSDPAAARRAAHDYLVRYPEGFARDDARRLTAGGP